MVHCDGYVSKEHSRFQISIFLRISLFLFGFEHREFRISCLKSGCSRGIKGDRGYREWFTLIIRR